MADAAQSIGAVNLITIAILLTLLISIVQGMIRGASGSARHLGWLITEAVITIVSIVLAWQGVKLFSPLIQDWLTRQNLKIPTEEIGLIKQMYYTFVTGIRDFPLLRFGVLFVIGYVILKQILYRLADPMISRWLIARRTDSHDKHSLFSATAGGLLGSIAGIARALMLIAVLFIYATLFPYTPLTGYIQGSGLYQKGAEEVIAPFTGNFIADKVPVFTRAVEQEFANILQRKYEVLDARIPTDIASAAKEITADGKNDEDKAKLLYKWVGTRIVYDWNKVKLYEEKRIWKEQTPEDTFASRKGVCIDYSRLYAVMARSIGLDVKVVTGLGYDGQGGYGPHAWNEVFLKESGRWVPLDPTWVSSGGNWFNPPGFDQTHIKEA